MLPLEGIQVEFGAVELNESPIFSKLSVASTDGYGRGVDDVSQNALALCAPEAGDDFTMELEYARPRRPRLFYFYFYLNRFSFISRHTLVHLRLVDRVCILWFPALTSYVPLTPLEGSDYASHQASRNTGREFAAKASGACRSESCMLSFCKLPMSSVFLFVS